MEALKAAAAQRLAEGQGTLDLGLNTAGAGGDPLEILSSQSSHLWEGLCRARCARFRRDTISRRASCGTGNPTRWISWGAAIASGARLVRLRRRVASRDLAATVAHPRRVVRDPRPQTQIPVCDETDRASRSTSSTWVGRTRRLQSSTTGTNTASVRVGGGCVHRAIRILGLSALDTHSCRCRSTPRRCPQSRAASVVI